MLYQKVLKPPSQTVKHFNSFISNNLSYRQTDLQRHVALNKAFVDIPLHSENLRNNFAAYEGMRVKNSQLSDANHFDDISPLRTHLKLRAFNIPDEIRVKFSNESQITIADKNVIGNILYRLTGEDGAPDTITMQLFLDVVESSLLESDFFTQFSGDEKLIEEVVHENDADQLEDDENCDTDDEISDTVVIDTIYDAEITTQVESYCFDANENFNGLSTDVEYSAALEETALDTNIGVDNELTSLVNDSENDLSDKDNLIDDEDFEDLDSAEDDDADATLEQDDEVAESETRVTPEADNDSRSFAELMDRWSIFSASRSGSDDREPELHNEVDQEQQSDTAINNDLDLSLLEEASSDNSLVEISRDDQIASKRRSF